MKSTLSDTQITVLTSAAKREDGNIEPLPVQIKGGARAKVILGLLNRALIEQLGSDDAVAYRLTDAGYAAVGCQRPAKHGKKTAAQRKTTGSRDNTKQAGMIALLKRLEGATLAQIVEATGWQSHTVRGAMSGALKKKLGLEITSTKDDGEERIYRIDA